MGNVFFRLGKFIPRGVFRINTATIEFVYFNCAHMKHGKPLTLF